MSFRVSHVLSFSDSMNYRSDQPGLGWAAWSSGRLGWLKRLAELRMPSQEGYTVSSRRGKPVTLYVVAGKNRETPCRHPVWSLGDQVGSDKSLGTDAAMEIQMKP